jgi:hypothetical protein
MKRRMVVYTRDHTYLQPSAKLFIKLLIAHARSLQQA